MKKKKISALLIPLSAGLLLSGCLEEGRMSPEEEDVDVVDPGLGEDDKADESTE